MTISLFDLVSWSPLHLLIPLVIVQRIWELRIARRNESIVRNRGAIEVDADGYPIIVALHTLWFIGMIVEIVVLSRGINPFWYLPFAVVLVAQLLRYWAIRSLGTHWNTRILVLPKAKLIARGPYRYLKHPNYIAVIIELLLFPIIFNAWLTAITASILNAFILRNRIRKEEEALQRIGKGYERVGSSRLRRESR